MDQILFSTAEAAAILGIAEPTLRDLVNEGAIAYVQLRPGRGDARFRRCDLEEFVGSLAVRRRGEPMRLPIVTNRITNQERGRKRLTASGRVATVKRVAYDGADDEPGLSGL